VTARPTAQLDLDHDVTAPGAARRFLAGVLGRWGASLETVERSSLLASELVSNAVLHGGAPIQILVSSQDQASGIIRVEVTNVGSGRPLLRRANGNDLSGRGLQLIEDLANGWGTESRNGQIVVWFQIEPAEG